MNVLKNYFFVLAFLIYFLTIHQLLFNTGPNHLFQKQEAKPEVFSDTTEINRLIVKIDSELAKPNGSINKALEMAVEAISLSEKAGYKLGISRASVHAGNIHRMKTQYPQALDFFLRAGQAAEDANNLGQQYQVNIQTAMLFQDWGVFEKAIENIQKALEISERMKQTDLQIKALQYMAVTYRNMNNLPKAEASYKRLIELSKATKNQVILASTMENLIGIYMTTMQVQEALAYTTEMLEMKKAAKDTLGMINYMNKTGILYRHLKQYPSSLLYFESALDLSRKQGKSEIENIPIITSIGVIYQITQKNDLALATFENILSIRRKENNKKEIANALNYIVTIHMGLGEFNKAKDLLTEGLDIAEKLNDLTLLEKGYLRLSECYEKMSNARKALESYKKYVEVRDKLFAEEKKRQEELAQKQFEAEKKEKELKLLIVDQEMQGLALEKLKIESEKKEQQLAILEQQQELQQANLRAQEMEKKQVAQALALAQQELLAQKKSREIQDLQRQQEVQTLELKQKELEQQEKAKAIELLKTSNALLEADQKLKDQQLQQEANMRAYGYGIIGLCVLVMIVVGVGLVQKAKANKLLQKQQDEIKLKNEELAASEEELKQNMEELAATHELIEAQKNALEEKNNRMTDSIRYAERIQAAILPPPVQLQEHFSDHFFIFQPKDMVSGDFYWFSHTEKYSFVAAVDCTGHGVPGAFMSMIGNTLLNQIVNEKKETDPDRILSILHASVREALKQRDSRNVDGMDICLCRIQNLGSDQFSVVYSGAKCPAFFASSGKVDVLHPDRKSIGGFEKNVDHLFTAKEIKLKKGDFLYLTTDGFIDAANAERKRFGTKNLIGAIERHLHRPLYEQKLQLETLIAEYQQGADQRDDITLVGIQL